MSDAGSSVTLIFYRMQDKWWKEPWLNLAAAACQMSALTHVEIGIGGRCQTLQNRHTLADAFLSATPCACAEHAGQGGQIANVCRVFSTLARPRRPTASSRARAAL
jgi:hypothetical protein